MANQDDNFLREVEEEIRRERFERLWKEYGTYFIAGAAVIVIGVLGYKLCGEPSRHRRADDRRALRGRD